MQLIQYQYKLFDIVFIKILTLSEVCVGSMLIGIWSHSITCVSGIVGGDAGMLPYCGGVTVSYDGRGVVAGVAYCGGVMVW